MQELRVGSGPEAQKGDAVLIDYVLRRANGYFIYGKCSCKRLTAGLCVPLCWFVWLVCRTVDPAQTCIAE